MWTTIGQTDFGEGATTVYEIRWHHGSRTCLLYFYDEFKKIASVYLLPFMPFDAISTKLGFEGLFLPWIDIYRYVDVAMALMDILPRVMPEQISRLGTIIATV
jgi:hypothetical protein